MVSWTKSADNKKNFAFIFLCEVADKVTRGEGRVLTTQFPQVFKQPGNRMLVVQLIEIIDGLSPTWLENNGFVTELDR